MFVFPRGRERPLIMGILNVTPDSFSDGGSWTDPGAATAHALDMVDRGADIIDVGAESTRPGAPHVPVREEISRLEPVLRELVGSAGVPVSVDTRRAAVAERCLGIGADIVNDVDGLRDAGMAEACASAGAAVVIMHSEAPGAEAHTRTMGDGFADDIRTFLRQRAETALDAGIDGRSIALDPGIGFGKTQEQNVWILDHSSFFSCGYPVLSGSSRKRVVRSEYPDRDIDDASADAAMRAFRSGADIVRVHDVARTAALFRRGEP